MNPLLSLAAQYGFYRLIRILAEAKANIEAVDSTGRTPLLHACVAKHTEVRAQPSSWQLPVVLF